MNSTPTGCWILAALLCGAPTAHAQGAPPFDLNDPGEAFQLVEMDLAIHDTELLGSEIDIRTDDRASAVRDQEGAGAESGSLRLLPGALGLCFVDPGNPSIGFCTAALDSEGTRSFYEVRNPPAPRTMAAFPGSRRSATSSTNRRAVTAAAGSKAGSRARPPPASTCRAARSM